MSTPALQSRLPLVGTTVFSTMSALASQHGAVNLGQGFPDFGCDPRLLDAVNEAMRAGFNQYPLMTGVPALREAIAAKIATLYGHAYDAATEITVTAGATQALTTAILCCVHPGEEAIVIEPAYDSYAPAIALAGGVVVPLEMEVNEDGYSVPWQKVAAAVTARTRLIVINSPHNPTGSVLRRADLDELAARAFVVSSFGKTYHVTGWKLGYVAAPPGLTAEFRKVHQYNVFTVNTPMQHGLAAYILDPAPYLQLSVFYQLKRDLFRA